MLGCQPVLQRDDHTLTQVAQRAAHRVVAVQVTNHKTTTMHIQQRRIEARRGRPVDAQRQGSGRAIDLHVGDRAYGRRRQGQCRHVANDLSRQLQRQGLQSWCVLCGGLCQKGLQAWVQWCTVKWCW